MKKNNNYNHLREKIIQQERVFDGKVIQVDHDTVELPDGGQSKREIVYHNGAVCLIAVHEGVMYFVRQYRVAPDEFLLEIPAGKIEKGDAPEATAKRELEEEVGAVSGKLSLIHQFYVSPGFSNEFVCLYEAENMEMKKQMLDDDEFLDIVKIPLHNLRGTLSDGSVRDSKTIIAIQYVIEKYNL
ncbi:NUDIX hydrolase [Salinicoccus carnicancri]|uniref:NUDIX hydrolase n=1 Tax=Salinicoccus carnicancri TaxID=558170 RepID=UPI0002F66B6C|nr:NUDIX hydrolase [Salinicoccus carnicancri]